jgi:hypothetical protein
LANGKVACSSGQVGVTSLGNESVTRRSPHANGSAVKTTSISVAPTVRLKRRHGPPSHLVESIHCPLPQYSFKLSDYSFFDTRQLGRFI